MIVPASVDHNMRVGLGYLRYHPRWAAHLNQSDHRVSTDGVGDGGGCDAAVLTPCSAVEDAGDGGEQNVAPVEVDGALVEVGETEEDCGEEKSWSAPDAPFEEVLQPAAEEELFGDGDEEEGEDVGYDELPRWGQAAWTVQKAEREAESDAMGM